MQLPDRSLAADDVAQVVRATQGKQATVPDPMSQSETAKPAGRRG